MRSTRCRLSHAFGCGVYLPSVGLVLSLLCVTACDRPTPPPANVGTVTIKVVDGAKTRLFEVNDVPGRSTVEDVMRKLDADQLPMEISGSGVTAFVNSIDGKQTGTSEGWLFKLNGEYSERGIGSTELDPPATIQWTYGEMFVPE